MAKWDIPNGVLGYEKRGFRATEQGCRGGVLGVEGREMGFIGLVIRPKLGETGEKKILLQLSRHGKRHHIKV